MDPSEIGRAFAALRKHNGGGGAKPRTVQHDPEHYCLCVDCRKARGQYPAHLLDKAKVTKPPKRRPRSSAKKPPSDPTLK
jgi:hypothetical protein